MLFLPGELGVGVEENQHLCWNNHYCAQYEPSVNEILSILCFILLSPFIFLSFPYSVYIAWKYVPIL